MAKHYIKTIRLFRRAEDSAERIIIKEFFRFIGCLVYDLPLNDINEFKRELNKENQNDVDIILNMEKIPIDLRSGVRPKRVIANAVKREEDGSFTKEWDVQAVRGKQMVAILEEDDEFLEKTPKNGEILIKKLIQAIWLCTDEEQTENETVLESKKIVQELEEIRKFFFAHNLLGYLLAKKELRAFQMGGNGNVPDFQAGVEYGEGEYILHVIGAFVVADRMFSDEWKREEKYESVYVKYVQVNAARKARETASLLSESAFADVINHLPAKIEEWYGIEIEEPIFCTPQKLNGLLQNIIMQDPNYVCAYFLAACLSLNSVGNQAVVNAGKYFSYMVKLIQSGEDAAFSAFANFHRGWYEEEYQYGARTAKKYYESAVHDNDNCYQACFKLAKIAARDGRSQEAQQGYEKVLKIFGITEKMTEESFLMRLKTLNLKELQYAFNSYMGMSHLAYGNRMTIISEVYLNRAYLVLNAYCNCEGLSEVLDKKEWIAFRSYHEKSRPVAILMQELKYRCESIGYLKMYKILQKAELSVG